MTIESDLTELGAARRKEGRRIMAQHTPGPWRIVKRDNKPMYAAIDATIETPDGCGIAAVFAAGGEANAKLIAAAPALLETLQLVLHRLELASQASVTHAKFATGGVLHRDIRQTIESAS